MNSRQTAAKLRVAALFSGVQMTETRTRGNVPPNVANVFARCGRVANDILRPIYLLSRRGAFLCASRNSDCGVTEKWGAAVLRGHFRGFFDIDRVIVFLAHEKHKPVMNVTINCLSGTQS